MNCIEALYKMASLLKLPLILVKMAQMAHEGTSG